MVLFHSLLVLLVLVRNNVNIDIIDEKYVCVCVCFDDMNKWINTNHIDKHAYTKQDKITIELSSMWKTKTETLSAATAADAENKIYSSEYIGICTRATFVRNER